MKTIAIKDKFRPLFRGLPMVAYLAILLIAAWQRNALWANDIAFFEDVIKKAPAKPRTYVALGMAYYNNDMPDQALSAFYRAIELNPDAAEPYGCLGFYYFKKAEYGRDRVIMSKAIEYFQYAAALDPRDQYTRDYLMKALRLKAMWIDSSHSRK